MLEAASTVAWDHLLAADNITSSHKHIEEVVTECTENVSVFFRVAGVHQSSGGTGCVLCGDDAPSNTCKTWTKTIPKLLWYEAHGGSLEPRSSNV